MGPRWGPGLWKQLIYIEIFIFSPDKGLTKVSIISRCLGPIERARNGREQQMEDCARNKPHFWSFCQRAAASARSRAAQFSVPVSIDAYDIDRLFADQGCCCAVTGQPFAIPVPRKRQAAGPSVDRIVPAKGYVRPNVRLVTNAVNMAMSNWGEEAFWEMVWYANTQPGKHIRPFP